MIGPVSLRVPPRLEAIARSAAADLTPFVVVNRRVDTAARTLAQPPDEPLPTIHTDGRTDLTTRVRRIGRAANERVKGIHGDGELAGHTGFGSVRFVPQEDAKAGAEHVVQALAKSGDVGIRAYGPVSFVASVNELGDRATYASDDTGATLAWPRSKDELPAVIAERLLRNDAQAAPTSPRTDTLLGMHENAAVDAVRGWLLSNDLARTDGYIEAQVRGLRPDDFEIAAIDTRERTFGANRMMIDPGPAPTAAAVEQLLGGAKTASLHATAINDVPTTSTATVSPVSDASTAAVTALAG